MDAALLLKKRCVVKLECDTFLCLPLNKAKEWTVNGVTYPKLACRTQESVSDYHVHRIKGLWCCECSEKKPCVHAQAIELFIQKDPREQERQIVFYLRSRKAFVTREAIAEALGFDERRVARALTRLRKQRAVILYRSGQRMPKEMRRKGLPLRPVKLYWGVP